MFKEFLKGSLFTAESLVTYWSGVHKTNVPVGGTIPQEDIDDAEEHDFHNIPVTWNNQALGYVCRFDISRDRTLTSRILKPYSQWVISREESLPQVARILSDHGTHNYPLFFVPSNIQEPLGVLTYADLNRRSCYIYTYTMINFIEQWAKKRIAFHYGRQRRLDPAWMESLKGLTHTGSKKTPTRWHYLKRKAGPNGNPLDVSEFKDLIHVIQNDIATKEPTSKFPTEVVKTAKDLRIRIAHPVKLIVPKGDEQMLHRIPEFWQYMVSFVDNNDFNDKNGGWPNQS